MLDSRPMLNIERMWSGGLTGKLIIFILANNINADISKYSIYDVHRPKRQHFLLIIYNEEMKNIARKQE